jgi:methyltransferase (TIGR00027 family)
VTQRASSGTAVGVAWLHAAHQVLDASPRILEDPVVLSLLGPGAEARLRAGADRFASAGARALRAHVVMRSRFAEERLAAAAERGVRRYLLLGAGLDTFAYRQPAWAAALQIVEVDHPASQADKRARLAAGGIEPPPNLLYALVDLEVESLEDALRRQDLWPREPAILSWLGVIPYLSEAAVEAAFRSVATLPASSEIVFSFASKRGPGRVPQDGPSLAERAAAAGEPWLSHFEPADLEARLHALGFSAVEFLTPDEARIRYFRQRTDDLPAPSHITIGVARV